MLLVVYFSVAYLFSCFVFHFVFCLFCVSNFAFNLFFCGVDFNDLLLFFIGFCFSCWCFVFDYWLFFSSDFELKNQN